MEHYLKIELYELIKKDPIIFKFFKNECLDGIWYWDLENPEEEWISDHFWEVLGYDPITKKHSPKEWQKIVNQKDLENWIKNYQAHLKNPSIKLSQILQYTAADGSPRWIRCRGIAIRNKFEKPIRILGTHSDVTELKLTEQKLLEKNSQLEQSNRDLKQFAYIASHDLREPLRVVKNYIDLFERKYKGILDDKAEKYINYIVDGVIRMKNLIDDLLTYSRVETQKRKFEKVDSQLLVNNVLEMFNSDITEKQIEIKCVNLPILQADPIQFSQIFQNLLHNSIKFHSRSIRISAVKIESFWEFVVKDDGIGFDKAYSKKIFQIFSRLHSREDYPGTGIGLAIVKRIVERHGGKIWVESTPGKGSTFHFTIKEIFS